MVLTNAWPVTGEVLQRGFSPNHPTIPLLVRRIALIFFTTHFQTNYSGKRKMGRWRVEKPSHLINFQPLRSKVTEAEVVSRWCNLYPYRLYLPGRNPVSWRAWPVANLSFDTESKATSRAQCHIQNTCGVRGGRLVGQVYPSQTRKAASSSTRGWGWWGPGGVCSDLYKWRNFNFAPSGFLIYSSPSPYPLLIPPFFLVFSGTSASSSLSSFRLSSFSIPSLPSFVAPSPAILLPL